MLKVTTAKNMLVHHYLFCNHVFKFQDFARNGQDYAMVCLNINDIAIIPVKCVDFRCVILDISDFEIIHLIENSDIDDRGYI